MFCVTTRATRPAAWSRAQHAWPAFGRGRFSGSAMDRTMAQVASRADASPRKTSMWDARSAPGFFVQRPSGPRKSGMPESVEMPAPVSSTMRRAASTSDRASATARERSSWSCIAERACVQVRDSPSLSG